MSHARHDYLPAAGRDLFLPLYDPLAKLLGADRARRKLDIVEPGRHSHNPLPRWLHTSPPMRDNTLESILSWMSEAGLREPRTVVSDQKLFGRIAYYRALAPG